MQHKHGRINFWKDSTPQNYSWFFKGLCNTVAILKLFCWIKTVNPSCTSLLYDPWSCEIPLALKPTFISMYLDLDYLSCSDFCLDNKWDHLRLTSLFGSLANEIISRLGQVDPNISNEWVWAPKTFTHKIASTVYHFLNHIISDPVPWVGWKKIWPLKVFPLVKHFLWLMFNGRISTADYLHSINLGPRSMCVFCNLNYETPEHLFHQCCKT